jgi:photosystem II stability/assembly factor-like uncharacterized protein
MAAGAPRCHATAKFRTCRLGRYAVDSTSPLRTEDTQAPHRFAVCVVSHLRTTRADSANRHVSHNDLGETVQSKRSTVVSVVCALGMCLGAPAALATPVSVGHSGWSWSDPSPQGETLNDVVFAGTRGFAVGDFGTVLRSEDGGNTWAGLPSGTTNDLTQVQEVEPDTIVVAGGCTVRESTNGGASFQRLPVNESESACATKVASFSFLSASTGFVEQADGTIFLTSNGGQTLEAKTPVPLNGATPSQLRFVSPTIGFAVTSGPGGGRIFRTTDGADSWTQVATTGAPLSDIDFVTSTTAYAVGANSTLLHSTDGGNTWTTLPLALPGGTGALTLTQISCSDETHCLIATAPASGGNTNLLVRTSDGGTTGTLVSASKQNLLSVAFSTATNAVGVGEGGATVLSSNGGETFPTPISHNLGSELLGLIRIGQSPLDAYAPWSAGQILATTDGGESWSLLRVPAAASLEDIAFPSTEVGYAVNSTGAVFRTADAGISWSILSSGASAPVALLAPNPGTVLLTGPRGVRRSTNSGASFGPINASVVTGHRHRHAIKVKLSSVDLSRGAELAGGAVFAYGKDVLESTDDGGSWTLIPRPLPTHPVTAIAFVSADTGYEVSDGRMFFTRSRGRSWTAIPSVDVADVDSLVQLSFSSASDGYVLGQFDGASDVLERTTNGGATWTPEILPFTPGSVTAAGAVDYAEGKEASSLFETTDGGLNATPSTLTLALSGPHRLSAAKLRQAGDQVRLIGHLSPAIGGENVVVSWLAGGSWSFKNVTVTSSGTFALTVPGIRATTDFIAQWAGDDLINGAGTTATQLTVVRRKGASR